MNYKSYMLHNFRNIPQIDVLMRNKKNRLRLSDRYLPFKTNNYVVDNLIDWSKVPNDPMFILTFPQKEMLLPIIIDKIEKLIGERS